MVWASRLSHGTMRHLTIGEDVGHVTARAVVFWHRERPVALSIAESSDGSAPSAGPARSVAECATSSETVPSAELPSVSLVICTRDRPQELARCLRSLPEQTHRPQEVIVVDNASVANGTEEICREANVRSVREPRPGLAIARN